MESRTKKYTQAPLPFIGQKRMFISQFTRILPQFECKTIFVDLFGGSGLLSHTTKVNRPDATVIYNDYDNYRMRLNNIPRTNALLADLRNLVSNCVEKQRITGDMHDAIIERIEKEDAEGYVDYITLSASIIFSAKTVTSLEELKKQGLYNRIRQSNYTAEGYLDGVDIVACDYKELFEKYKNDPHVVFLVDPPYLHTDVGSYTMSWKLADYLDVLTVLKDSSYVYFTSNKSDIIELCEWIGSNKVTENPFTNASKIEFKASLTHNSKFTDIMLYKQPA
ncbi:MAG: DNA adenine methylase [Rikenellaceae bacterium]